MYVDYVEVGVLSNPDSQRRTTRQSGTDSHHAASSYRRITKCPGKHRSPAMTIGAQDSLRRPRIFCLTSHVNSFPNFPTLCWSD